MVRELKITPIKNGTVIDHVTSGLALEVLRIIGASNLDKESTVSVALHVRSRRMGWKDIVKVENMELSAQKINAIALLSPTATISIIRDFKVVEKRPVTLPDRFTGVLKCPNPNCITNKGEPVEPDFEVVRRRPLALRCLFCDRYVDDFLPHLNTR
ncbi:MAG: aspartate carbamoyltransferase regulatory subunit [Candidatus Thermoplasmatota archaeon]|jgi:aspartate carbamoyltransferase regulatory subunit|nr:aspartate carbamoyltransferase regulatory subunit [Candidatus Thermoplasmatota archaeon]MCL5984414.1 aspartate carbamoyltransferase regulatory subunit [Candidatus Thermoplasmatota archaeon]